MKLFVFLSLFALGGISYAENPVESSWILYRNHTGWQIKYPGYWTIQGLQNPNVERDLRIEDFDRIQIEGEGAYVSVLPFGEMSIDEYARRLSGNVISVTTMTLNGLSAAEIVIKDSDAISGKSRTILRLLVEHKQNLFLITREVIGKDILAPEQNVVSTIANTIAKSFKFK